MLMQSQKKLNWSERLLQAAGTRSSYSLDTFAKPYISSQKHLIKKVLWSNKTNLNFLAKLKMAK